MATTGAIPTPRQGGGMQSLGVWGRGDDWVRWRVRAERALELSMSCGACGRSSPTVQGFHHVDCDILAVEDDRQRGGLEKWLNSWLSRALCLAVLPAACPTARPTARPTTRLACPAIWVAMFIGWSNNHFNNLHFKTSLQTNK